MSDSASNKLAIVKEIITEGKIEDALQLVKDIEQIENLTPEETLKTLWYRSELYIALAEIPNALKFAEKLFQKSQEMKMSFFSLDALYIKGLISMGSDNIEDVSKISNQYERLFNSLPRDDSPEYQEREVGK